MSIFPSSSNMPHMLCAYDRTSAIQRELAQHIPMSIAKAALHERQGLHKGDTVMFLQQENDAAHPSQQTLKRTPPLALRVGSRQDPGIRRKYRPNKDTLLVTHSSMPCASSTPMPFVLLAVADGMGGQEHGRTASRIAARTLARHVTEVLRHEHRSPTELLQVLAAGVQLANRSIYEHNQRLGTAMGTTLTAALVSAELFNQPAAPWSMCRGS
jgi:Protein phosphatase 2C